MTSTPADATDPLHPYQPQPGPAWRRLWSWGCVVCGNPERTHMTFVRIPMPEQRTMTPADKAFSFGATEAIRAGDWDNVLPQIGLEIKLRMGTEEYKRAHLARAEFIAGD